MNKSLSKSTSKINFSIVIPNRNGADFLPSCLTSLIIAIQNCPQSNFEIIIVDNASTDESISLAKKILIKKSKNLSSEIYHLKSNTGFAAAVNYGINQAKHSWVAVLNNDLTIENNWFEIISQEIKHRKNSQETTFFGTVLNNDGTKFESQGFKFDYSGKCTNISNSQKFNKSDFLRSIKLQSSRLIWGAPAALIVYQKEVIQKIGLFDEDFFAYEEDVDLSFRLHTFGYKTVYIPTALSYHLGGGTSNKMGNLRYRMDAKNWFYILIKNYSSKDFWSNLPSIFIQRLSNLYSLIKKTIEIYRLKSLFYLPIAIIKVYGEVIINLPNMFQKRHEIKNLLKSINKLSTL